MSRHDPEKRNATARWRDGATDSKGRAHERTEALADQVLDAAFEVHRGLGAGLAESCYQLALAHEFDLRRIPYQREHVAEATYKDIAVGIARLDFLVGEVLVVELKAVEILHEAHAAQTLTYCRLTNCELGLLLNFGAPLLKRGIKRIINFKP